MAKTNWKITGKLQFAPQLSDVATAYGNPVPLAGVKVLVEAKEISLDPTWDNWGEDVTDANGEFTVRNEKDRSGRMFRVRAMFKDDDLKIYPPNTGLLSKMIKGPAEPIVGDHLDSVLEQALTHVSRLMFDVDWFTVHQDDNDHKHDPDDGDLGALTFQSGAAHDLGDRTARRHAEIWFVCKLVMNLLEDAGSGLGFPKDQPVAILHPHNNPLINDEVETSFSSPYNKVAFLVENAHVDGFDLATIIHEFMHLWVYQRSQGEDALAWQLLVHGSTHEGLQKKEWVAAHEGIAEWANHQLYRVLFGVWPEAVDARAQAFDAKGLPFTLEFLRAQGVNDLRDVDHSEYGWMSLLNILRNDDIATIDVTGHGTYAPQNMTPPAPAPKGVPVAPLPVGGERPGFLDVLHVLNEDPKLGVVDRSALNLTDFLDRALAIMPQHSADDRATILALLDTRPSSSGGVPLKHQEPKPQAQMRRPAPANGGGDGERGRDGERERAARGRDDRADTLGR